MVDDRFLISCLGLIPDCSEFLIVESEPRTHGGMSWHRNSLESTHVELREEIEESRDMPVAAGPHPSRLDDKEVFSAYVPDEDATVRPGRLLIRTRP